LEIEYADVRNLSSSLGIVFAHVAIMSNSPKHPFKNVLYMSYLLRWFELMFRKPS